MVAAAARLLAPWAAAQVASATNHDYWAVEDAAARERLPPYQIIPAATAEELTPANGYPKGETLLSWTRSHGDNGGMRYSALRQINHWCPLLSKLGSENLWLYSGKPVGINGFRSWTASGRLDGNLFSKTANRRRFYEEDALAEPPNLDGSGPHSLVSKTGSKNE